MALKKIEIKCEGAALLPIADLQEFQGNLKTLSTDNYAKLKKEILELGFSEPVSVWKQNGKTMILNGHQRLRVIRRMIEKEGFECSHVPVSIIQAKSVAEAKRKVLALTSQYGEITEEGLYEFMSEAGINIDEIKESFRFPEIDFGDFEDGFFKDGEVEEKDRFKAFSVEQIKELVLKELNDFDFASKYPGCLMSKNLAAAEFNHLCAGGKGAYWLSILFNPHRIWVKCNKRKTPAEGLANKDKDFIKMYTKWISEKYFGRLHPDQFVKYSQLGFGGSQIATEFKPWVARDIYERYCPKASRILDPCHGWGGRVLGAMSTMKAHTYVGVDPSKKTHLGLMNMIEFISSAKGIKAEAEVHCKPFEKFELPKREKGSFEFAFTSPPYFDTEKYSEDPEQSFNQYKTLEEFNDKFMKALIEKSMWCLKPGGILLLNVGNRVYPLKDAVLKISDQLGLKTHEVTDLNIAGERSNLLEDEEVGEVDESFVEVFSSK